MTRSRPWLSIALLGMLVPGAVPARPPVVEGTFLQLLDHHRSWDRDRWSSLLDELSRLGIEEIVVQWTVHGDRSFLLPEGEGLLERLLTAADGKGMEVVLGLVHDPDWWSWLDPEREDRLVEVSLRRLERRHLQTASRLRAGLEEHESFAGWYLPEEVGDRAWLPDPRRAVLTRHFRRVRAGLEEIAPGLPVAVSGFSNGFADPRALAGLWIEILEGSGIERLLFQDGVGAGKLSPTEVPLLLGPLSARLRDLPPRFQVVVEVFRQIGGEPLDAGPFRAEPADRERILAQLEAARTLSEGGVLAFSAPEYLTSMGGAAAEEAGRSLLDGTLVRSSGTKPR